LRDVRPTHRLGPIRASLEPCGEVPEVGLQVLSVVLPRLAIHARGRIALERQIGIAQPLQVVDVMQERGDPLLPILPCCLAYPLERAWRVPPALGPERVALDRVSLGQPPSLHRLRRRLRGLVRRLHWYYAAVRLPMSVRHRRVSLDFPIRSAFAIAADGRGTSRFPCRVFPYMRGVSDRAGFLSVLPERRLGCCLPPISTASASRRAR